jgi:uncharacterized cupredoxin-like copper-binding protein
VVTNPGTVAHDFVIGNENAQQAHERQMAVGATDGMLGGSSIEVPAGATATLVYTFDQPGTLLFGCHVPGHYAAGMRGTISVTSSYFESTGDSQSWQQPF